MEIIKRSERIERVTYGRLFEWRDMPGAGFSFDCDRDGNVDRAALAPEAVANLDACLDGTHDVVDQGVVSYNVYLDGSQP